MGLTSLDSAGGRDCPIDVGKSKQKSGHHKRPSFKWIRNAILRWAGGGDLCGVPLLSRAIIGVRCLREGIKAEGASSSEQKTTIQLSGDSAFWLMLWTAGP